MQDLLRSGIDTVLSETRRVLEAVDLGQMEKFLVELGTHDRTFSLGEGRSGLVVRMFAMRLVHLGRTSYVVGETTTPAMGKGDLMVAISGSGQTAGVLLMARQARDLGARLLALTTDPASELGQLADRCLVLQAPSKHDAAFPSEQFAGSLFEQSALLVLDALFLSLASGRSAERLMAQHTNLE